MRRDLRFKVREDLESLTICGFNYKGRTFSSVNIKTLSVDPAFGFEPRPPARKPDAQLLEPPVRLIAEPYNRKTLRVWKSTLIQ